MPDDPQPDLDLVQRWFQSVITHPDGVEEGVESAESQKLIPLRRSELEKIVRRSKNLTAEERLGIYANAYYARLIECLRESFPVLAKALGRDVFDGFAFGYLQSYPSKSYTLNRLGDRFAEYLDQTRPQDAGWADFLIDLAHLEWTVEQVFDGPGVETERLLSAEDLRGMDPAKFGDARIVTVPCLALLKFKYSVNDYYSAARKLREEEPAPPIPQPGEEHIALTRRDYIVRRIPLSPPQYALLDALSHKRSVNQAIAAAAEHWNGDSDSFTGAIRAWFGEWGAAGLFWRIEYD